MESPAPDVGKHYADVTAKMIASHRSWAVLIHVLTAAAIWPSWRSMLWVVGTTVALIPLNTWVSAVMMRRHGPIAAEGFRTCANLTVGIVLYRVIGWPLPIWLWLPYMALAYGSTRRMTVVKLTASWLVMTAVALHDGVSLILPLTFGGAAYLCLACTDKRLGIINAMFARSEEQRLELDAAHASLRAAVEARARVEIELRQSQKLEAIGRLASGVAHEINTPLQYLATSVTLVGEGVSELTGLIDQWRARLWSPTAGVDPALLAELEKSARDCDLAGLETMLTESLSMAHDGVISVSTIVRSMKEFAHPERLEKAPLDLNRAIHAMLAVAKHEYRYVADLTTRLEEIPAIEGHAGELSQLLLNLVVNAAHAVGNVVERSGDRGRIEVSTYAEGNTVVVSVSDTGCGIPDGIRDRIFEPFFTTKEVGHGTGQGLAMARATAHKHGGSISFTSAPGKGTTFLLRLPMTTAPTALEAA